MKPKISLAQKRELAELTLLEKRARVVQMREAQSKGRCDQVAVDLMVARIPILEAILSDYVRACAKESAQ